MYNRNKSTFTLFGRLSGHKISKKRNNLLLFSCIAILHSVIIKDDKYYPQGYMEEYKEYVEETSYFHNYFDSDSDSAFEK